MRAHGVPTPSSRVILSPLSSDEVRVLAFDLDAAWAADRSLTRILSSEERERAAGVADDTARGRFAASRAILRLILSEVMAVDSGVLALGTNNAGKPFINFPAKPPIHFNVSHSGADAMIALSLGRRVGIDIERIRTSIDADSLIARFFSTDERRQYDTLAAEQRTRAFFATWTRKEAFVKAIGLRIADTLNRFSVTVDPDEAPKLRFVDWPEDDAEAWELRDVPCRPGLIAALAVEGSGWHLRAEPLELVT